jgi:hypothetical protein
MPSQLMSRYALIDLKASVSVTLNVRFSEPPQLSSVLLSGKLPLLP